MSESESPQTDGMLLAHSEPAQQPREAEAAAPSHAGSILSAAREARGLSVVEIAAKLKLRPRQVVAIEQGVSGDAPPVVIRGWVRNYARLLDLDPEALVGVMTPMAQPETLKPIRNRQVAFRDRKPVRDLNKGLGVAALSVVVVAVVVTFLWRSEAVTHTTVAVKPSPVAPPRAASPVVPTAAPSPASAAVTPPAASAQSAPPTPGAAISVSAPMRRLVVRFDRDSWVEVKESAGKTLYAQVGPQGTEQIVEGVPPLEIVVGNASGVRLTYKDMPVDLKPYTHVDVARLKLE